MFKSRMKKLEERVEVLEKSPVLLPIKIEVSCMSIGENIKNRRKAFGMTQEKLADTVGINRSLRLAADMAKVLQCDVNDFLSEKEE